jgi:hypothetical protein
MSSRRTARMLMRVIAVHPKKNTPEEEEYIVAALVNILKGGTHPIPPRPREWEEGREIVEITEEVYSDGTTKFINREETVYRKGGTPRHRREESS